MIATATYDLKLTAPEKAEFLEAARLAGDWMVRSQNAPPRPWSVCVVEESADLGRFIEKETVCGTRRKPAGVWLTGAYLAGLSALARTPVLNRDACREAVLLGARYLKSLQCFDVRYPAAIGGFHEIRPGDPHSAPRDAATGTMGLIALYRETGELEYLDRAVRFAEWYASHGSDRDGYPWDDYDLVAGQGSSRLRGDWQAGGALVYHQLLALTGQTRWKRALRRVLDVLTEICAHDPHTDTAYDFHGACRISVGNDDFANLALFAGHLVFRERALLDLAAARLRRELTRQAPSGAFPGYGGTFVTALELLDALDMAAAGHPVLPAEELREPLLRAARFGLSLQERQSANPFLHGGVYGQCNYGLARDVVHGRDAAYGLQLWLRLAGYHSPIYSAPAWMNAKQSAKKRKA